MGSAFFRNNLWGVQRTVSPCLWMIVAVLLAACGAAPTPTPTLTPVPSSTPTTPPTATPEPSPTPAPEITEEATAEAEETLLLGEGAPPPFEITLPDGWQIAMQNALFIPDVDATARPVQVTVYEGPVSEGTGTIVVMWGFPNFMVGSPFALPGTPTPAPNLWSDGLRLFRTAMVEQGCNAGTDLERTYNIGDRTGSGTKFAIVDCPETPDTRGWFVGLQEDGLNFVFFVYAEPIEAMDTSEDALQGILDSIEFHVSESFPAD